MTSDAKGRGNTRRAEDAASLAMGEKWVARLARAGIASRGVVYLVVALLVAAIAFGRKQNEADGKGALDAVAGQPLGRVLLVVLCVGFVGYILWQLLRAVSRDGKLSAKADAARRLPAAGAAILYSLFLLSTVRVILNAAQESSQSSQQSGTARLLSASGGRAAVLAAGLALVAGGLVLGGQAVTRGFEKPLNTGRMSAVMKGAAISLGVGGEAARALAVLIIGGFVLSAAAQADARQSKGLDAALRTLAGKPFGGLVLAAVGLGFLAYGLYSFIEMRYRDDLIS
ncbi:MAG: DUF1206 domain-containing protein [Candidatus Dormibacteria bacterium]